MATSPSPLNGVVVIDLTRIVAGPHCTKILCDLGARVIKVELKKDGGDMLRFFQPRIDQGEETTRSAYFAQMNSGKESIVLDLSLGDSGQPNTPADRETFEQLLSMADVMVENFRPGRLDRIGYGWDAVHVKHPQIVVCSISGFGQTGPYKDLGGVDTVIQAMSGFVSTTGFAHQSVKVGTTVSDLLAGVYAAVGVQAALLARTQDGEGRYVDISMLDTSFAFHLREFSTFCVEGKEPVRMGSTTTVSPVMGIFPCEDGLELACAGPFSAAALADMFEDPEIAGDQRFQSYDLLMANQAAIRERMGAAFLKRPRATWIERLRAAGWPAGPVNKMGELAEDPQLRHRRMIRLSDDGRFNLVGNPIKINGMEESAHASSPPSWDAHGDAIRKELLSKVHSKL